VSIYKTITLSNQNIYGKMKLNFYLILLLSLLLSSVLYGQENKKKITITGIVVDANHNPIANAVIMIDKKKTNCLTDLNGSYKIKVKLSAEIIGIFAFNSIAREEAINDRQTINFILASSNPQQMNNEIKAVKEEEINIGYGTVKKENMTGSSNKIDGQNKNYASYHSIYEMISGEIPGVQVSGKSIKIQGVYSVNSGTEPLFIVDGITVTTIDNILPQMVKSIEVLKGPDASIYGSRAANGVILITLVR
jgi:TonB-dependent starch-binding outer membrane protein SusC